MRSFANNNLLVFGDSIINGSGNNNFGIGEYLAKKYGFKLFKYCVGGARTGYNAGKSWIVDQVKTAVSDRLTPGYIVFNGFTNDCNMSDGVNCDVPLGEIANGFDGFDIFAVKKENTDFSNCFENILHALKTYFPEAKPLFVRPHKMGRRDKTAQAAYGERAVCLCKKWGVEVADIYEESDLDTFKDCDRDKYTSDTYGWGRGDCTHPNARGYEEKYMPIIIKHINSL